ncbi:MAG: inosine/xanthosine triphosphatase [Promethearchaeota archaeon]
MEELNICVGSLNPVKIKAVRSAFKHYFNNFKIFKIEADSKVPPEPIGMETIIRGAINRAKAAINYLKEDLKLDSNIFGIGIEAGLVEIPNTISGYMDFQYCAIMDEKERITLGSGIGFEYPSFVIDTILSGKSKEIGEIMGKIAGDVNLKKEKGSIGFLSKDIIKRKDILKNSVICALLPRINSDLYDFK